ncbi:hypothetical protein J6590_008830 [Homalodisca vitripennis]|nr:hypothetical protein J6590_008830 [Homalodisca vitripennis]
MIPVQTSLIKEMMEVRILLDNRERSGSLFAKFVESPLRNSGRHNSALKNVLAQDETVTSVPE